MRFFSSVVFLFTVARLSTRIDGAGLVALNHQANTGLLPGPIDQAYSTCCMFCFLVQRQISQLIFITPISGSTIL